MQVEHDILDLSGPTPSGYYNFEGNSAKLGAGCVVGEVTKGYPYYAFEEPWVEGCMAMQGLGFTATQILEARDATEPEEREPYMTHGMLLAEQAIDDMAAWEDSQGFNDEIY